VFINGRRIKDAMVKEQQDKSGGVKPIIA